jgi:hypothetical protein
MVDTSNGVLYGVFVVSGLLGGTTINFLGPQMTAMFGVTGYPVYVGEHSESRSIKVCMLSKLTASLWYFDATGGLWFPVLAGGYLGLTAGCLFTTASMFLHLCHLISLTQRLRVHRKYL